MVFFYMNLIIDKYMSLCNTRTLFKFYLSKTFNHHKEIT
jgi:hypothetical protein